MKKLLVNYIFDKIGYYFILFLNSALIIMFYKLMGEGKIEVLYPVTITAFLMCIFLVYDLVKYLVFNSGIQKSLSEENYKIRCFTREQREISKVIKRINYNYVKKENELINIHSEKIHFLANGIHKFKNYISVIALIIDRNKEKTKFNKKVLKEIEEENNNLESSLEQVLSYIKMDNFQSDFDLVKIDMVEEIKLIINQNKARFINNEVFPVFNYTSPLFVYTDKKWNRIVIEQVITNAIKYNIGSDNRKIYFELEENENKVLLKIIDNGVGIPEYDLNRVFEAFFTGENGRKIRNSTGIGLFITKNICKRLKHSIEIESEEGMGTKVIISYLKKL